MKSKDGTKETWFITGGCGFIGTSLIRQLVGEGRVESVVVYDNLTVGQWSDVTTTLSEAGTTADAAGVRLVVGDVKDFGGVLDASGGAQHVVHLAANTGVGPSVEDPRADLEANVMGTFNVLEAARKRGARRVVFASSGAPVGEAVPPISEQTPPRPKSPYGASKLAGEGYCSAYFGSFGLETVALRFSNVYGPRSRLKDSVVAKFIKRLMAGEPLEIYGDGEQTRDFLFIDDLVDAVCRAARGQGVGGQVFQIASGRETTINALVEVLSKIALRCGKPVQTEHSGERVGDVRRSVALTDLAENLLGWKAAKNLGEGLDETFQWFQAQSQ